MRVDRDGRLLQQLTIWLPVEQVQLLKANGVIVNRFFRELVAVLLDDPDAGPDNRRETLVQAALESIARYRQAEIEREAGLERTRAAVRVMRAERDAAKARQDAIAAALLQVAGDDPPARLARLLPEHDPNGDRMDDWDALVRRVSRLCGAEIDSAEVVAGVRAMVAKA